MEEAGLWGSLHPATLLQLQPDHAAALVRYVDPHATPPPQTTHPRFTLRPRLRLRPSLGLSLGLGLAPTRYADLVDESDAPLSEWVKTTQASCLARRHTPRRVCPRVPPCAPTLPHASPWEAPRHHAPPRLWQVRPAPPPPPPPAEFARQLRPGVALELLLNDAWWPVRHVASRRAAQATPKRAAVEHLVTSELYGTEFWVGQAQLRPSSDEAAPPQPPALPPTPSPTPTPTPSRGGRAPPKPPTLPQATVPTTPPLSSKPAVARPRARPKAREITAGAAPVARPKASPAASPPAAAKPRAAAQPPASQPPAMNPAAKPPAAKPAAAKPGAAKPAAAKPAAAHCSASKTKKRGHVYTVVTADGTRVDRSLRLREDSACESCGALWPKGSISYNVLGNYRSRCRTHGEACVERPVYQKLKGLPRTR